VESEITRGRVLVPAEPDVYRNHHEHDPRSSGAQCFQPPYARLISFRSVGARRDLLELSRSINISTLRDEEAEKACPKNKKFDLCITNGYRDKPIFRIPLVRKLLDPTK